VGGERMSIKSTITSQANSYERTLYKSHKKWKWLNIPAEYRHLFPYENMDPIILEYNGKPFQTSLRLHERRKHNLAGGGLTAWFNTEKPSIGDTYRITRIRGNTFRLELVK
jgi:hypothetical protein